VPAQSPSDWAKAIDQILGDAGYAAELRARGRVVAAKRTWARSADLTLEAIARSMETWQAKKRKPNHAEG